MKRLLFISHRVPFPPDKGERVRAFHEIKALSQHFRITLAALACTRADRRAAESLRQWCERVLVAPAGGWRGLVRGVARLAAGGSLTEGYFASRRLRRLIDEQARRETFDLVFAYSSSMLQYALDVPAPARVMDLVDVDSAKWADYAAVSRWPKSLLFRREARAVRRLELAALEHCDAVLVVSDAEAELLGGADGRAIVIANGVDADYFAPQAAEPRPPALVFTGTMDYWPNVQGVCWFVRDVWPGLKRAVPELTFTIVGRDPAREVRELAALPGVVVTGTVDDVRPYLATATVAICPLQLARGVQNKVLEAMAAGRAVVASPPSLRGLEVEVGKEALAARTPGEWQETILELLEDDAWRSEVARAARACVLNRYRWADQMERMVDVCNRISGGKRPAGAVEIDRLGGSAMPESVAAVGPGED